MEHLPVPYDCLPKVPKFEYIEGGPKYDGLGFSGFLERVGTSPGDLSQGIALNASTGAIQDTSGSPNTLQTKRLTGLVQEWCWFGLLHELELFTGVTLDTSRFVRQSIAGSSTRTLTTEILPEYIAVVQASRPPRIPYPPRGSQAARISACLHSVETFTSPLATQTLPKELEITLGYVFLLTDAVIKICQKTYKEDIYVPWRQSSPLSGSCCLSRRNYFQMLGSASIQFITDRLPSFDSRDHADCSPTMCAYNANLLDPVSRQHTEDCEIQHCEICRVDEQTLVDILSRGGIPGIRFDPVEKKTIIEDVSRQEYVAFSHVWVHGLGNPAENALPQCQVRRLALLVNDLSGPSMRFWIDTLAVPTDAKHKPLALAKLRQVYRSAERVIVLDKHLEQVQSDSLGQSLQLLGSDWLHRLWTLQEGKLARKLCIRFRDKTVELADLVAALKDLRANDKRAVFINMDRIIGLLQGLVVEHKDTTRRILWVAMSLCYRSVTIPLDEPVCLATLLGLDLESYQSRPTMVDIYRAFANDLPEDLAFFNGQRLSESGLRWAPASLLHQPKIHIWSSAKAKLGDKGFIMNKDYLTFETIDKTDPTTLKNIHYLTQPVINDQQLAFITISPPTQYYGLEKIALILHTPGNSDPPSSRAILVETNGPHDTDMMSCRFIAIAQTARESRIEHAARYLWKSSMAVRVTAQLRRNRKICID